MDYRNSVCDFNLDIVGSQTNYGKKNEGDAGLSYIPIGGVDSAEELEFSNL
jgi:hypothetical protein